MEPKAKDKGLKIMRFGSYTWYADSWMNPKLFLWSIMINYDQLENYKILH